MQTTYPLAPRSSGGHESQGGHGHLICAISESDVVAARAAGIGDSRNPTPTLPLSGVCIMGAH